MPKLTDLEATFVGQYNPAGDAFVEQDDKIDGAQGVLFNCPLCGNHSILAWFRECRNAQPVPANVEPGPGRWTPSQESTGLSNLTLTPSINLDVQPPEIKTCRWHGFVTNGETTNA